ncbi:MAG: NUDIX hydrolase [Endomicrobiales bacterium]|nr:NUDIX hydrolase [Endomicrobiales bacterium]
MKKSSNFRKAIKILEKFVPDPSAGLPEDLFYYVSSVTPLVNVDLLIKDEKGRTLLAWRDDKWCGRGWHVPGGIIRFKESFESRIRKVARNEIGVNVKYDKMPAAINQIVLPRRDIRGHFISVLYKCSLSGKFKPKNKALGERNRGFLKWHDKCPEDLLKHHVIYRKLINSK